MVLVLALTYGSFNTQPPEGGCRQNIKALIADLGFNTQPPGGGCSLHKKSKKNQQIKYRISLTDFMIRSLVSITAVLPLYK